MPYFKRGNGMGRSPNPYNPPGGIAKKPQALDVVDPYVDVLSVPPGPERANSTFDEERGLAQGETGTTRQ